MCCDYNSVSKAQFRMLITHSHRGGKKKKKHTDLDKKEKSKIFRYCQMWEKTIISQTSMVSLLQKSSPFRIIKQYAQ